MMVEFIITKKKKSDQTILRVDFFFFGQYFLSNKKIRVLDSSSLFWKPPSTFGLLKNNTHLGQMWNLVKYFQVKHTFLSLSESLRLCKAWISRLPHARRWSWTRYICVPAKARRFSMSVVSTKQRRIIFIRWLKDPNHLAE